MSFRGGIYFRFFPIGNFLMLAVGSEFQIFFSMPWRNNDFIIFSWALALVVEVVAALLRNSSTSSLVISFFLPHFITSFLMRSLFSLNHFTVLRVFSSLKRLSHKAIKSEFVFF